MAAVREARRVRRLAANRCASRRVVSPSLEPCSASQRIASQLLTGNACSPSTRVGDPAYCWTVAACSSGSCSGVCERERGREGEYAYGEIEEGTERGKEGACVCSLGRKAEARPPTRRHRDADPHKSLCVSARPQRHGPGRERRNAPHACRCVSSGTASLRLDHWRCPTDWHGQVDNP